MLAKNVLPRRPPLISRSIKGRGSTDSFNPQNNSNRYTCTFPFRRREKSRHRQGGCVSCISSLSPGRLLLTTGPSCPHRGRQESLWLW